MKKTGTTIGWFTAFLCLALLWGSPAMAESYELYIAGTQVTADNCNNLKDITGVTVASGGEFKYDPAKRTLTMKDVTVSGSGDWTAISNRGISGLTIAISGTNRLTATVNALGCLLSTKIKGSGSLTITSSDNVAIFLNSTTLTVSDITLEATGDRGIAGGDGKHATLIIKNATVTAKGKNTAISDIETFTLNGCGIIAPEGGKFDDEKHAVVDAQGNVAKEMKIAPVKGYSLYIAGTQVTANNCNNLKDIKGVTVAEGGEFKYDPEKKKLTMKDVTVSGSGDKTAISNSDISGLTIAISGTNRLTATNTALNCFATTKIEGNGSLTTASAISYGAAVFVGSTTLTISNITLEATGGYGIAGANGNQNETLIIKNATVTAKGTAEAAIANLKTLTLEECRIIAPEGAEWKAEKKAVVDAGGNVAKEVKIEPAAKKYELFVAEVQVTDDNCDDLSGINGVTVAAGGVFKYDPATKTLTMKDVTVSVGKDENAIWNKSIEGLEIVISGSNRLEATDQSPLNCFASTKIEGSGSFTTTSKESSGINIYKTTLTISDITLEATGKRGIAGFAGEKNETLIIKNATVTAKGTEAAIANLKTFTLEEGCQIIAPAGAEWKDEKHAVVDAGGNPVKEVRIGTAVAESYELYIAGTQVTADNCNNLKDITGVTVAPGGEFKYDPASKTLTMKGVTVSAEEYKSAIRNNGIEGLKIEIAGTNSLKMKDPGLDCFTSTELKGNGSLTIASASDRAAVFVGGTTLTISDITLEATGAWGIAGNKGDKETLTLKNATVNAKGTVAAICDLKTFTLEGCKIVAPEGAEWKAEKKAVVNADGSKAQEVKIGRGIAVTGVKVTPTTVDLKVTETKQLTITVEPATATNKNYTCKSDKEGVATVDNTGLVTAVGVGTATITITTEDGGKTITCSVNVTEGGIPTFALNPTTLNVAAAGATLSINVTSDKAWTLDYDSSVMWLTASAKTGTGSGAVTFTVEKNEATTPRSVVVTFKQAETEKELKLTITQEAAKSVHVPLQGISFTESALKLKVGTSTTLVVKYNPENATNKKVTWEVTEGEEKLTVDANSGKITATNVTGTAKVKATSEDGGHTAECTITVTAEDVPVESIAVSPAVVNLTVEGTQRLSVSVKPRTATNKTATWAVTAGADVVSVDGSGLVRALKEGTATVTATVGGKTATCTVTVTAAPAPLAVEDAVLASLVIAPNPFTAQLRIVNPEGIALRYELVTLTGNVVRAGTLDGTETIVDTEALPAGLYFVRLTGQNGAKKVVKVVKY